MRSPRGGKKMRKCKNQVNYKPSNSRVQIAEVVHSCVPAMGRTDAASLTSVASPQINTRNSDLTPHDGRGSSDLDGLTTNTHSIQVVSAC